MPGTGTTLSYGEMNLIYSFRFNWLDMAMWTRSLIQSIFAECESIDATLNRLYRIPQDFSNRMQLIFGIEKSNEFRQLVSMHIMRLLAVFNAQKENDREEVKRNTALVYDNIEEIAKYLASINPFWNVTQWTNLLNQYIYLTFQQSTAMFSHNHERNVDIFDRMSTFTILLGDYMAEGIIQFIHVTGTQGGIK